MYFSHRMILPSSTSRKRELAIGTALKQFNVDPQPIATDRVTNAFNNLRNSVFTGNIFKFCFVLINSFNSFN